jgi:hypothetical protein
MTKPSGAHTHHGGAEGAGALAVAVIAVAAAAAIIEWILSVIIWIAIALGLALAIGAVVVALWLRGKPKRQAAWDAAYAEAFAPYRDRRRVASATVPQAAAGARPAIEYHVHHHYHGADRSGQARVITGEVEP